MLCSLRHHPSSRDHIQPEAGLGWASLGSPDSFIGQSTPVEMPGLDSAGTVYQSVCVVPRIFPVELDPYTVILKGLARNQRLLYESLQRILACHLPHSLLTDEERH